MITTNQTIERMSIEDYKKALKTHDWYYQMTEDPRVYSRGASNHKLIMDLSTESQEHQKLYVEFVAANRVR